MKHILGVVMDPIGSITIKKDTTYALLLEAQARGWAIRYMEMADLYLRDGEAHARTRGLKLFRDTTPWFEFLDERDEPLAALDAILMRKDPPFDMEYIHATYLLEHAEARGALVVNRPQGLRDANEKLYTAWFPQCMPPTLVAREAARFRAFLAEQGDIIVKPLGEMGGASIFRLRASDPNVNVVLELMTGDGARYTMAQRYLPEIAAGDKRIIVIDGEPACDWALARIPAPGETRGNLAAGGRGVGVPLTERDRWMCAQVGPALREKGLLFVGLDVIGDYLTEINVTSPTCVRELDAQYGLNLSAGLFEVLEKKLSARPRRAASS
jgi:glutathione synthase